MGYREEVTEPFPKKYIIALAPHTSNMDFIIGMLYCHAKGFTCNFLMKKEWFFWPLGILMRKLGGIPVYRNKKQGMTDIAAQKALEMDKEKFLRLKKDEIIPFIEEELATRYWFQEAGIQIRLRYDEQLKKALEL